MICTDINLLTTMTPTYRVWFFKLVDEKPYEWFVDVSNLDQMPLAEQLAVKAFNNVR